LKDYWNKQKYDAEINRIVANTSYDQILNALTERSLNWCDSASNADSRPCASLLSDSLDLTIKELRKLRGSDMESWRWGDIHQTFYEHLPFSHVNFLASIFERKIPSGGSPDTINVANAVYHESTGYEQTFSAGFRQIIQFQEVSVRHLYMNSTGQSGNVLSAHYDDMVKPFRDVQYRILDDHSAVMKRPDLTITPK
jgi:penicillin amidase